MAVDACFVCGTVSPGSLPALETVCVPSGKSIAEQLCKGLNCCLLPLMPEHAACILCQQTVSHLDQLWTEVEMLQRDLSNRFLRKLQQADSSHQRQGDGWAVVGNAVTSGVISNSSRQLSPLPDVDDLSNTSASSVREEFRYAPADASVSQPDSSSFVTMEGPISSQTGVRPCPRLDNDIGTTADAEEGEENKSIESAMVLKPRADNLSPEESTHAASSQPPKTLLTPASQISGRTLRTGPKTCPHCGRTYKRWRDLDTHLSVHTGSLAHQCAECGRQFASRRRLTDHQRGHAGGWSCQLCDKVFRHPSSLQHHRRRHERTSPASVCPVCSRALSSAAQLRAHLRTHTGERPYQCESCPRTFRQASTLRVHARLHSGERPFQCETCGKGFHGRAAFMTHLQQHGAVAARFACDTCGKTFFYKSKMEQHRASHGGQQTACCEQCGVTFSSVAALRRHQVTHSTQRPHACSVCGRRFKEAGVLRKHQRQMHTADATHVCSVCGKRCAGPFKLSEHMRTHTGERPFACPLCPKSFTQAVHLSMHERTHQRAKTTTEFGTA